MPLVTAHDRTVPVTVQTRTTLSPADAFRIIVPIDLSLVFTGWGPFPGVSGVENETATWDSAGPSRNPGRLARPGAQRLGSPSRTAGPAVTSTQSRCLPVRPWPEERRSTRRSAQGSTCSR